MNEFVRNFFCGTPGQTTKLDGLLYFFDHLCTHIKAFSLPLAILVIKMLTAGPCPVFTHLSFLGSKTKYRNIVFLVTLPKQSREVKCFLAIFF
jgi:hypothetical protein